MFGSDAHQVGGRNEGVVNLAEVLVQRDVVVRRQTTERHQNLALWLNSEFVPAGLALAVDEVRDRATQRAAEATEGDFVRMGPGGVVGTDDGAVGELRRITEWIGQRHGQAGAGRQCAGERGNQRTVSQRTGRHLHGAQVDLAFAEAGGVTVIVAEDVDVVDSFGMAVEPAEDGRVGTIGRCAIQDRCILAVVGAVVGVAGVVGVVPIVAQVDPQAVVGMDVIAAHRDVVRMDG